MKKRALLVPIAGLALALVVAVLLAKPAAIPLRDSSGDSVPGMINVAVNAEIRSTNPGINRDINTDAVLMHMVEGLVAPREDGTVGPLLAEHVEVAEDLKTFTFRLRYGVRFHNGDTLTSAHVIWSWRRYLDPKTRWLCLSEFDGSKGLRIESIEAPDLATVVFRLNRPRPLFLTDMASFQCGGSAILHPDSLNADGSWRVPVGTGPYRFGLWKRGQYIQLNAFSDYTGRGGPRDGATGGKMSLASAVRWIVIKDEGSRRAALLKGQIDLLPGLTPAQFVEMGSPSNISVMTAPSMSSNALLIQTRDPLMTNLMLRRALAHSIDMRAIVKFASGEAGVVNASMVPKASSYHSAVHEIGYSFDLDKAKQLVARSGYRGQPIRMLTNRRFPDMYDQAIMIQGMAKKAGINIKLEVLEWATQLDRFQTGNYQLMSFAYSSRPEPSLGYDGIIGDKGKSKRKVWANPKAIELLAQLSESGITTHRQAIFDQLHQLMLEDVPLVMLFNPGDTHAVKNDVRGFVPWSQNRERLWNVHRITP